MTGQQPASTVCACGHPRAAHYGPDGPCLAHHGDDSVCGCVAYHAEPDDPRLAEESS